MENSLFMKSRVAARRRAWRALEEGNRTAKGIVMGWVIRMENERGSKIARLTITSVPPLARTIRVGFSYIGHTCIEYVCDLHQASGKLGYRLGPLVDAPRISFPGVCWIGTATRISRTPNRPITIHYSSQSFLIPSYLSILPHTISRTLQSWTQFRTDDLPMGARRRIHATTISVYQANVDMGTLGFLVLLDVYCW